MSSQVFLLCLISAQCVLLGMIAAIRMQRMEAELRPSLRDQIAIEALAALIGHEGKDYENRGKASVKTLPAFAYQFADSMLEARK